MVSTNARDVHLVDLRHVTKTFTTESTRFTALDDVSLRLPAGEFIAIVGKSGSGKSTLINVIAGIDRPSRGEIYVDGTAVHSLDESRLAEWRGRTVGVVFQFFQLLPTLTILENVMLPMDLCGTLPSAAARERAMSLLERVRIADHARKLPAALSGGEQQRAAIARALANDPALIVADEPTGNLDSQTADAVLELLTDLARSGKSVLMVTHERDVRRFADRTITLADGQIVDEAIHPRGDARATEVASHA